ncbi:hypothetical protein RRG08_061615 [Elysia crispata]|uniref:Uncharacterized protein n=1 Tax=Elysia crispata TaxID=231223 RepID=A0AAE1D4J9_9GAST|nr:hypothetical protein RRG08_061615 [Elysia crispata]
MVLLSPFSWSLPLDFFQHQVCRCQMLSTVSQFPRSKILPDPRINTPSLPSSFSQDGVHTDRALPHRVECEQTSPSSQHSRMLCSRRPVKVDPIDREAAAEWPFIAASHAAQRGRAVPEGTPGDRESSWTLLLPLLNDVVIVNDSSMEGQGGADSQV